MSKKNEPINQRVTRLQSSRYEREQQQRRIIVIGALVVGVLTILLVGAALLQIFVLEPQRVVASTGGQNVSVSEVQKRMRYDQGQLVSQFNRLSQQAAQAQQSQDQSAQFLAQFYQQQLQQLVQQGDANIIARNSLDTMIDRLVIRQEATRRGIAVTAQEVQDELEKGYGLFRQTLTPFLIDTPAPTFTPMPTVAITVTRAATEPTPAPTVVLPTDTPRVQPTSIREDEFKLLYQQTLDGYKDIGYNEAEVRTILEDGLIRQKLQKAYGDEMPKNAMHFKFDFVKFNTQADADKALTRLTSNQITFPALISETNAITQPAPIGNGQSVVDWTSKQRVESQYGPSVLEQLSVKSIGAPTGVITSSDGGFYIVLPLGREDRALEANELESEQQRTFNDWLTATSADASKVTRIVDPTTIVPSEVRTAANNFLAQFGTAPQP